MDVARQIVDSAVQVVLERGEPRFGPLEAGLRGAGGGDRNFRERLGLFAQLADRLLVQLPQRRPLARIVRSRP